MVLQFPALPCSSTSAEQLEKGMLDSKNHCISTVSCESIASSQEEEKASVAEWRKLSLECPM